MKTRAWKVYGAIGGHRQRESFCESYKYDFSNEEDGIRIIEVENADKTGTNEYSIIRITRNTAKECELEFRGQLFDGVFENSRVGVIEEIEDVVENEKIDNKKLTSIDNFLDKIQSNSNNYECSKENITKDNEIEI